MNFRAMSLLSRWIEQARTVPEYASRNQVTIDAWLELMLEHLFPKWDARGYFIRIEGRGGVYRGLDYPGNGWDRTLPHEKSAIAVDGLVRLHRVSGSDAAMARALELGAFFKSCLSLVDGHYEWMSWVPSGAWDVRSDGESWVVPWVAPDPNAPWYVASTKIAVTLHQHGLLFGDEDIARFVKTQREMCWNGDPDNPVYRNVKGETGKFVKGKFLSYELSVYDPTLSRLAFQGVNEAQQLGSSPKSWKGGVMAGDYLEQKLLRKPVVARNGQPENETGRKFLARTGNAQLYDALGLDVVDPGFVFPSSPADLPKIGKN